jgi:hypothetical protein
MTTGRNRNSCSSLDSVAKARHVFEAFPPEIEPLRALPYRARVNDDCRMRVG